MANLFISEYSSGPIPTATALLAEQEVALGGSSAASALFNAATTWIRVVGDGASSIALGATPVAAITAHYLPANVIEWYVVPAGGTYKIAAITNT